MTTYHCSKCDTAFRHEDAEAVFCPKCETKCEIVEASQGTPVRTSGKFSLFLALWSICLVLGPIFNLIPAMLFGVYATSVAMLICGLLFGAVITYAGIQTTRRCIFYSTVGLLLPVCTFYLIPNWLISLRSLDGNPSPLWPAALFFFTVVGFAPLGFKHPVKGAVASLVALVLAVQCLYAEPEEWFRDKTPVPLDREWSSAVNLTQTEPLFSGSNVFLRKTAVINGKLYRMAQSALVWNAVSKKWEKTTDGQFPLEDGIGGLPVVTAYSQNDDPKRREAPAQPELVLTFRAPAEPNGRITRRYAMDMKQLYPEYDADTTQSVDFIAVPKTYLSDGRLYFTYQLSWHRFEHRNGTTYCSGDQGYLQPGTLTLDLQSGKYEVTRGAPLQNSKAVPVESGGRLLVFFNPPYDAPPDIRYVEYDYGKGLWSKQEKFIRPGSMAILFKSVIFPDYDTLHCVLDDQFNHRVRAPLILLSMDGYTNPGEILYRRRNLKTGEWSKIRKLSPGIKFAAWLTAAKNDKTLVAAWLGKQSGETMPPTPSENPHLYYALSTDNGDHWTPPQEIPVSETLRIRLPEIFIAGDQLHLFFKASPPGDIFGNRDELYHMTRTLSEMKP